MSTLKQQSRRERAVELVQRRIDFWESQTEATATVDGKECDVPTKLTQAKMELANLRAKLTRTRLSGSEEG